MSVKLAAIGNVLMGDDGIAIAIAKKIEPELNRMGIEVVYGETDVGYCISVVDASDDIIILDASAFGKKPGEITRFELTDYEDYSFKSSQHHMNFPYFLKLYYPGITCHILAIEVNEVSFQCGISPVLSDKEEDIGKDILKILRNVSIFHFCKG